jgi:2-polyprenyl-3-methyl-5-hydroxy-6-metoxy-1,4-benzoquinol methylase
MTATRSQLPDGPYPLGNNNPHAPAHHELLSTILDPFSTARTLHLVNLPGKRCLEVGAGGGGYARWLADRVGPTGHVLATDVNPLPIQHHPRLTVIQHDLTSLRSLDPDWAWDFIHARLVLNHLPQRQEILSWLVANLAPGGTILVEDWDASRTNMVLAAPDAEAAHRYTTFQEILGARVFAAAGTDRTWARRIHAAMLTLGLTNVDTHMHGQSWAGGGDGCQLIAGTARQVRDRLLAAGLTAAEFDGVQELLDDPRLVLAGHLLYSTSGTKPAHDGRLR